MNKSILSACLSLVLLGLNAQPKQLILYIGDGFGIAPKTAARMAMGQGQANKIYYKDPDFQVLALDKLRYTAMATTHSANSWTTDSAPGAGVYATGQKMDNEVISFDLSSAQPIETILEKAKKAGYAVGLVTTTRITHATPASFGAHSWHRDLEDFIAQQYLSASSQEFNSISNNPNSGTFPSVKNNVEIDVLLGGGMAHFLPKGSKIVITSSNDTVRNKEGKAVTLEGKREDGGNLLLHAMQKNYVTVHSRQDLLQLNAAQFSGNKKLLGLFAASHLAYEQDRQLDYPWQPSLAEMTAKAIEILKVKGGKKGFFLLVEGGRIDHLGHANAGLISSDCQYEIDSVAFPPDGGISRMRNTAQGDLYGSDYMIKEVIGFDYAIHEGQKLLKDKNSHTLLFSTSDHECGAVAVIALYDSTHGKPHTYPEEPTNDLGFVATVGKIKRADLHFPEYTLYEFQGKYYPKPKSPQAKRIIITYASNPIALGHRCEGQWSKGNHTPQDIWVGSDDNIQGKYASKITGKGMIDNTSLYPIMMDFLGLKK